MAEPEAQHGYHTSLFVFVTLLAVIAISDASLLHLLLFYLNTVAPRRYATSIASDMIAFSAAAFLAQPAR